MRECLDFIYQNYYKLRKYPEKCDDIDENILFNRLNSRILKLFPKMEYENDLYYNTIFHTLKRADFWAVPSKTYYNSILTKPELSGKMFDRICKTKIKVHTFPMDMKFRKLLYISHLLKMTLEKHALEIKNILQESFPKTEYAQDLLTRNFSNPKNIP